MLKMLFIMEFHSGIDLAGVVDSYFQGILITPDPAPPRRICQFSRGGAGR